MGLLDCPAGHTTHRREESSSPQLPKQPSHPLARQTISPPALDVCEGDPAIKDWLTTATAMSSSVKELPNKKRKLSLEAASPDRTAKRKGRLCSKSWSATPTHNTSDTFHLISHHGTLAPPFYHHTLSNTLGPAPSNSVRLPLTKANLWHHTYSTMSGVQSFATPISSKKSGLSSPSKQNRFTNAHRLSLEDNGMYIGSGEETEENRPIFAAAKKIVDDGRHSAMKDDSVSKLVQIRTSESTSTEMAFQAQFWTRLMHDTRFTHQPDDAGHQPNPSSAGIADKDRPTSLVGSQPEDWIERAWDADHLKACWSADFFRDSIPVIDYNEEATLAIPVFPTPRIQTPRPDIAYGLKATAFTKQQHFVNKMFLQWSQISAGLFHGFFLIECKTDGSIEAAENQACRGGACLVNARMEFNKGCLAYIGDQDLRSQESLAAASGSVFPTTPIAPQSNIDLESFAFSLVLLPAVAFLYVHWAETKGGEKADFHMDCIKQYRLRAGQDFKDLRHDINNILDWGTLKRKSDILNLIASVEEKMEQTNKRQRTE